jgi:hypothetical protein
MPWERESFSARSPGSDWSLIQIPRAISVTVVLGGHLPLSPAPIAAPAVATMLSLVLVRLAHQTAGTRALRTLALVIDHADKWLHRHSPAMHIWGHNPEFPRNGNFLDNAIQKS